MRSAVVQVWFVYFAWANSGLKWERWETVPIRLNLLYSDYMYMIESTAARWRITLICVRVSDGIEYLDQPQVLCSWTWKDNNRKSKWFGQEWRKSALRVRGRSPR